MRLATLTGVLLCFASARGLHIEKRQYPYPEVIQDCLDDCALTDYNCQANCFATGGSSGSDGSGQSPLVECVNSCSTGDGSSDAMQEYRDCMTRCAGLTVVLGPTSAGRGSSATSSQREVVSTGHAGHDDDDDDDANATESQATRGVTATDRRAGDATSTNGRASSTGAAAGSDGNNSNSGGGGGGNGNSLALGLGLGIGIPLGLGIIAVVWFLVWRTKRKEKQQRGSTEPVMGHQPDTTGSPGVYKPELDSTTSAVSPESNYTSPQTGYKSTTPQTGYNSTTPQTGYQAELASTNTPQTYRPELAAANTTQAGYHTELDSTNPPMSQFQQYRPDAELSGQSAVPPREGELIGDVPPVRYELGSHTPFQGR